MELRDALRLLRSEIGMTQSELAAAVNVGYSAESRWENKNTRPNKASSLAILALAEQHGVSAVCLDALNSILLASRAKDKADKEKLARVTQQMKLEERILLTAEQMKMTIDNLDLAVIVQRISAGRNTRVKVIYQNKRYADIFGYEEADFSSRSKENPYFALPAESRKTYLKWLKQLLEGQLSLAKFVLTLRGFKKGGQEIWLEIKGLNLTRYSYGHELFLSCRDVTAQVEAEQNYANEVTLRQATIQRIFAGFHCDITANVVFRQHKLAALVGVEPGQGPAEDVFSRIAQTIPDERERGDFNQRISCAALQRAFARKEDFGSRLAYNSQCGRWLRYTYVLVKNPYTNHIEATFHIYDMQNQVLAEKMLGIISEQFFDYIGVINTETEMVESYYTSERFFQQAVTGQRHYPSLCRDKLLAYTSPAEAAAQSEAVSLPYIRSRLSQEQFYSTILHFQTEPGRSLHKKVTYTYLDATRQTIIVAQSDLIRLREFTLCQQEQLPERARSKEGLIK